MSLMTKLKGHPMEAVKVIIVWAFILALAWFATPSERSLVAGLPLVVAGLLVRGWAAGHLVRNKQLATSGPYAYVRDPLYVGRFFLLCGFAVVADSPVTYVLFGVGLLAFFLDYMPRKLRKETQRLQRHFGQEYTEYHCQVRSLIPRLTPYPGRARNRWSFAIFWRENREHWFALAAVVLLGAMALKM